MRTFTCASKCLLALVCIAPSIQAAQVTIVLRRGGSSWQLLQAEKITFNQKDKLRVGSSKQLELRPDAYKALHPVEILQAGVLRRHAGGYLVRRVSDGWEPVVADGVQLKTASTFAAVWAATAVAIQADRNAKNFKPLQPADVYAIIPGADASEALANLIADPANFRGVGEANEDAAFDERMSLLVAATAPGQPGPPAGTTGEKSVPWVTGAGAAKLQGIVLDGMQIAERRLSAGIAKKDDLNLGLKFVIVSAQAYPSDPQEKMARDTLLARKVWLDQRIAILNALRAGELWDAFLAKYSDFDRWDNSFDTMRKARAEAFQKSGQLHRAAGDGYYKDKNYALALHEFQTAKTYLPGDQEIVGLIEKVSLENERQIASIRDTRPEVTTSANYRLVTRHLQDADLYIGENKLADAQKEIDQARGVDPKSPRILLSAAKLQRASNKLPDALRTLEDYFRQVADDGGVGDELRNRIRHELNSSIEQKKAAIADAENAGDYAKAWQATKAGLELDVSDLDFLYHAGLDGAILRKPEAGEAFDKYLSLSQTPGADQKRRADVYGFRSQITKPTLPKSEGTPNWFSGYNNPPGLMYCPISLMPNARIADIKSRKQTSIYKWEGDHLLNIQTSSPELSDPKVPTIVFEYSKDNGGVRRVGVNALDNPKDDPAALRFTEKGVVGTGNGAYLGLPNNPVADPLMVERLTGKRVATLVAGNRYFDPFVWTGVFTFLAEYDDQGRVTSARQVSPPEGSGTTLRFKWDGLKLVEIDGDDYKREIKYNGNRVAYELITAHGKGSKIEYRYRGDRLVEADAGEDASLDNRPRHVTFQ
jgi:hypothetical protein